MTFKRFWFFVILELFDNPIIEWHWMA